jgi:endonuclease/exonuclease/phosphatase family metal-dependent hydrolase
MFYRLRHVESFTSKKCLKHISNKKLRVLSYNVFLRPPIISHKCGDFKNERTQLITNIFPYFDIILLQEVHTCLNFRCNTLITEARRHGLFYHYCNYGPAIFSRYLSNNGLLILSKYPITASDCIAFNNCVSYDTIIEKGCNYIRVNLFPNLDIHVFNSHLQSSYQKVDKICENIRAQQLVQIKDFIKSKCNMEKDAIICGGDFNINSFNIGEYKQLNNTLSPLIDTLLGSTESTINIPYDSQGLEDNQVCTVCKKCLPQLKHMDIEPQRLDYIYYNENHSRLKYKSSKILPLKINRPDLEFLNLSDHAALASEFSY